MLKKSRHKKRWLLAALLMPSLLFFFQNCSPFSSVSVLQGLNQKTSLSGNGGGYEGKLTYYRFVPDLICNDNPTYKHKLVFDFDQIWLYENIRTGNSCQENKEPIRSSEITKSPFQDTLIVVRDYLYARYNLSSQEVPTLLAESLCRDNWDDPSFEIINYFDYKSGEATTKVYYKSATGDSIQNLADSTTQRLLTPLEVYYQSFDGRLKYNLNLAQGNGTYSLRYSGSITFVDPTLSAAMKTSPLSCVTGGGLDKSVWPLKKVNISSTISNFLVHPTENDIYFDDRNPNQANWWRPFVLKNETSLIDISSSIFKTTMYVKTNLPIENSKWMSLVGLETDGTPYFGMNVYIYRPDDPTSLRTLARGQSLSSFIPNQTIVASEIKQISDSEFGYWVLNRYYSAVNAVPQDTYNYRIFNWQTLQSRDYLKTKSVFEPLQSIYFKTSPWPLGTVGILRSTPSGTFDFLYLDLVEKIEKIRTLPNISDCTPSGSDGRAVRRSLISLQSRTAVFELVCTNNTHKILALSLESGAYYFTDENKTLIWNSQDGESFLIADSTNGPQGAGLYDPLKIQFVSSQTGSRDKSEIDPHLNTSQDSLQFDQLRKMYSGSPEMIKTFLKNNTPYLVGFSAGKNWAVKLKNLKTRAESTVCTNARGEKIDLVKFADDQLVLVTFQPGVRIEMYEVSEAQNCKLLNSAPVKYDTIRQLVPTKSGLGVTIGTNAAAFYIAQTTSPDEIYFLNKDGRAPLHINLNNVEFSRVIQMDVSFDHSKLYILGASAQFSIYQTLFWLPL